MLAPGDGVRVWPMVPMVFGPWCQWCHWCYCKLGCESQLNSKLTQPWHPGMAPCTVQGKSQKPGINSLLILCFLVSLGPPPRNTKKKIFARSPRVTRKKSFQSSLRKVGISIVRGIEFVPGFNDAPCTVPVAVACATQTSRNPARGTGPRLLPSTTLKAPT